MKADSVPSGAAPVLEDTQQPLPFGLPQMFPDFDPFRAVVEAEPLPLADAIEHEFPQLRLRDRQPLPAPGPGRFPVMRSAWVVSLE